MFRSMLNMNRRRLLLLLAVGGVGLIAVLLIALWAAGVFDSAPPPPTLQSAVESVRQQQEASSDAPEQSEASVQSQSQVQPQAQPEPQPDAAAEPDQQEQQPQPEPQEQQSSISQAEEATDAQPVQDQPAQDQPAQDQSAQAAAPNLAALTGAWTVSTQGTSFVGYRIGEELAQIGATTAVGRTNEIDATLSFDGTAITSVEIVADLRALRSDQSFRDGALRTRGLESDIYPFATFVLSEPIPISALPTGEESLDVTVQGTLELHGVTNPVRIALQGQYVEGLVVVIGSTEIALADYEIEKPTGFRVLSIEDVGIMEFQLIFERAP